MREKMAELQFEAPLAQFDGDEWNEFNDYQTTEDMKNSNKTLDNMLESGDTGTVDNFNDSTFSGSLEDLVSSFDEKISKCFCNNESVEKIAPVQLRSQDEIMEDCQMWWTITGNFGNILPIDWGKSYSRQLQENALNLTEPKGNGTSTHDLDLSDEDEDLEQAFDMHSLIISSLADEPMFTAEEVINEIDSMMEEGSDTMSNDDSDLLSHASSAELLHFREKQLSSRISDLEQGVKSLTVSALNELLEELEVTIRDHSEVLIAELALRDELEYEKELKNQFMSLIVTVQQKRKEFERKKAGGAAGGGIKRSPSGVAPGATEPGTYLTTVIPYHAGQGPPTIEQMQIYIKILRAINDDSPMVPGLLTDYILKVLCPTS